MRTVVIVSAGLGTPSTTTSLSNQLGGAVEAAISARGESTQLIHLELRNLATDLATAMTTGGMLTPALSDAQTAITKADGIIAVTPVFSASYSGLFKMFFDVLDKDALVDKPVLLGATAGTARHSLVLEFAMRPLFAYLRARVVATSIFAAVEDFGGERGELGELGDRGDELNTRIARAAGEFASAVLNVQQSVGGLGGATAREAAESTPLWREKDNFESLLEEHLG